MINWIESLKANEIYLSEFTQEIENESRLNWQAPFAEKYLDLEGEIITGDDSAPHALARGSAFPAH